MKTKRQTRGGVVAAAVGLLLGCDPSLLSAPAASGARATTARQPGPVADEAAADGAEQVRVAYPRGSCPTGVIEVQLHRAGAWQPHPQHPRVRAGDVRWERADSLLALRVRCIDPRDGGRVSPWVIGVRLSDAAGAATPAAS